MAAQQTAQNPRGEKGRVISLVDPRGASSVSPGPRFAESLRSVRQSPLRDVLPMASGAGVISFALGMPASELFPRRAFAEATAAVLADPGATLYGEPCRLLKRHIVKLMEHRGIVCHEDQVFLTAGSQQGLSLISQLLLDAGDAVIAEDTIYDGLNMVLQTRGAQVLNVTSCSSSGMNLDEVEALLQQGHAPAFLYCIPDGHNPLGVSMDLESRTRLVALAQRYQVPIVEDDAYGFLSYDSARPTVPLRALDDRQVFYLGSFSKVLAPALRLGWIVVPGELTGDVGEVMTSLSILKQAADFDTATLMQRALARYFEEHDFYEHLEQIRTEYRRRRDTMVDALERHFPEEAVWNRPSGGLFLWLELPQGVLDMDQVLGQAVEREKVAFLPGRAFSMGPPKERTRSSMRLCFAGAAPELIGEGIARLGHVLKSALAHLPGPSQVGLPPREDAARALGT